MNIEKLIEMQIKLDDLIMGEIKNEKRVVLLDRTKTATIVEFAEFINEVEFFKYWKKNKKNNKEKQLEEFADVMHFLLSYMVSMNMIYKERFPLPKEVIKPNVRCIGSKTDKLIHITNLFMQDVSFGSMKKAFGLLLVMGELIGFTEKEMIEAYKKKNKVNIERNKNNY